MAQPSSYAGANRAYHANRQVSRERWDVVPPLGYRPVPHGVEEEIGEESDADKRNAMFQQVRTARARVKRYQ